MRITGGRARGITLKAPKGQATRPAADATREALFSSLGDSVLGSWVLDLFAGTGSYGLEALSRGAALVQFVESDVRCVACIKENIKRVRKSCGIDEVATQVSKCDVFRWRPNQARTWDILIADPPYADFSTVDLKLFELADRLLSSTGRLILEQPADLALTTSMWKEVNRLGKKRGSGPSLSFWKRDQEPS